MKKILFIAPKYFDYEKEIMFELKKNNYDVDYYSDRVTSKLKFISKIYNYLPKQMYFKIMNKYLNKILEQNKRYDLLILIKGDYITENFLKGLKIKNSNIKMIMYQWDSFNLLNKNINNLLKYFDISYSFDEEDCKTIKELKFKPLFFIDKYRVLNNIKNKYKFMFVGIHHSNRYEILQKILELKEIKSETKFIYLYKSKISYLIEKYIKKINFGNMKIDDIKNRKLSNDIVSNKMLESEIIIDIAHPNQTGLTMRTIEALGSKRKIITTNKNIKKYDFYNENNIYIIENINNIYIEEEFLKNPFTEISNEIYEKYSLKNWVKDLTKLLREKQ